MLLVDRSNDRFITYINKIGSSATWAIASKNFQKSSFESVVKLPTNYVTGNYGVVTYVVVI